MKLLSFFMQFFTERASEGFVRRTPRLSAIAVPPTLLLTQKVVEASSQEAAAQPGMYPMHLGAAAHPINAWEHKGARS